MANAEIYFNRQKYQVQFDEIRKTNCFQTRYLYFFREIRVKYGFRFIVTRKYDIIVA